MRILKLTFENINSYEGRVEIDFTDPWFQQGNNQFVISGPTGAGKSTILDAITLALYGSTARLGRLTMSSKEESAELINKRSGACRAEVVYSCAKGVFKSEFELHKAYGNVNGNVQIPQCALSREIGDGDWESLLDKAATETLQKETQKIIGLSYDQFVSCILIPQGEFDKFLNSDDREKAEILAKLSHTEHYRKAAQKLAETASAKSGEYVRLKKDRDDISVMADDERKAKEDRKQELADLVKKQEQELKELTEKLNWLDQFKKAEEKLSAANESLDSIRAGREKYDNNKKELGNARNAEDCDIEYQALLTCEEEQKNVQAAIKDKEGTLQIQKENLEKAGQAAGRCLKEYEDKKQEREEKKALWAEVRKLDTAVSVAGNALEEKKRLFKAAGENLESSRAKCERYEKSIVSYNDTLKELKDYLDKNKKDETLAESLTGYAEKIKARKKAEDQQKKALAEEKECQAKKEQLIRDKDALTAEKKALSDKLYEIVSGKYLLVADILRKDLKPGGCCPVCGKAVGCDDVKDHETSGNKDLTGEQNETAMDISRLKDSIEKTEEAINTKDLLIQGIDKDIEAAGKTAEDARKAIESQTSEIGEFLAPWEYTVDPDTSVAGLEEIGRNLTLRKEEYKKKKEEYDNNNRMLSEAKVQLNAIDINKLQELCTSAEAELKTANDNYTGLSGSRKEKFGDMSVDKAEAEFERELGIKETAKNEADKNLQDTKTAIKGLEVAIGGFKDREKELAEKLVSLNAAFKEKLEKYNFADEKSFLDCRRKKVYIVALEESIKQFERKKAEAETAFQLAESELKKFKENILTSESRDTLKGMEEELGSAKSRNDQEIGSLKTLLKTDDGKRKEREEADKQLQELGGEAEIYKNISEMLGKNDGADFEVFVQGIAMRSLLERANIYLKSIFPAYSLVQTAANSVSFRVNETMGDGSVHVRELNNFSGGEKFIISLSMALAMAEFAGQNGDVECVFLDEGFGTLSGDPLVEAINALKKLSSTGKMLGIITHIDAVVNQFKCIVADKRGERSILSGGGVTCTEIKKKKDK